MEIQKEGNKPITVFIKESVQKHQSDGRKVLTGESSAPGATGPHLGMCVVVTPGDVCGCHTWGGPGMESTEIKDTAQHSAGPRTPSPEDDQPSLEGEPLTWHCIFPQFSVYLQH
jgi:hypothetical protein